MYRSLSLISPLLVIGLLLIYHCSVPALGTDASSGQATSLSLEEERKQMKQAGLPTSGQELLVPLPPSDQNAAELYRQMDDLYRTNPLVGDDWTPMMHIRRGALSEELAQKIRTALQNRTDFGQLIHQAAERPECVFDQKWVNNGISPVQDCAVIRNAAIWLSAESALQLYDGKPLEAIQTDMLGFHLAQQAANEPTISANMNADSIDGIALSAMERILYVAGDRPDVGQAVQKAVEAKYHAHSLAYGMRGEIILYSVGWESSRKLSLAEFVKSWSTIAPESGVEPAPPLSAEDRKHPNIFYDRSEAGVLHSFRLLTPAADKPYPEARQFYANYLSDLKVHKQDSAYWSSRIFFPVHEKILRKHAQFLSWEAAVRTAAAVFAWKVQHGAFPERLEDAMTSVPVDPFDGKPLRYKRQGQGFVVYSVGPTGKFDGGSSETKPDAMETRFRYPMPAYMK